MKGLILALLLGLCSQAHAAGPAPCFPKFPYTNLVYGSIPAGVTTAPLDTYAVWVCEMPDGYITYAALFNLANTTAYALKYVAGLWTKAQADADCAVNCVDPVPSEATYLKTLQDANKPNTIVAAPLQGAPPAGSTQPQPVYAASDPKTPLTGQTVAVGVGCWATKKIPGTSLYSVSGQPNQANAAGPALGDVYATCSINFPLAPVPLTLKVSVPNAPNTVYTIAKTTDQVILLPVGTVPAGTSCDTSQQINQGGKLYSVVPRSSVSWSGNVQPLAAFAQCGGG